MIIKVGGTMVQVANADDSDHFIDGEERNEGKTSVISADEYQSILQAPKQKIAIEPKTPALNEHGIEQRGEDKTTFYDIRSSSDKSVPSYNKVVIISNKGYGKEFILNKPENFIGREPGCAIQIDDKMASGQHALISVRGTDCYVKDLKSSNGTNLNGQAIRKERQIRTGDEIEVGSTTFRFIHKNSILEKDAVISPDKRKKNGSSKGLKFVIVVLTGVLVVLLMLVFFTKSKPESRKASEPIVAETQKDENNSSIAMQEEKSIEKKEQKRAASEKEARNETATLYFSMANQLLANQLWQSAIDQYNSTLVINPEFLEAKEALEKAKFEMQNQQIMEKASALLNANQFEEAIELFRLIPLESVYYQTAMIKIPAIEKQKNALAAKKPSKKIIQKAVESKPGNTMKGISRLIGGARDQYAKGNVRIAIENLDGVLQMKSTHMESVKSEVAILKDMMIKVDDGYHRGLSLYNNDEISQAFQIWAEVLDLDKKIIGQRNSFFSLQIAMYIADEYTREAEKAFESNEYELALSKTIQALKAQPSNQKAIAMQGKLNATAKKLYEKAYILEDLDTEKALAIWKEVLNICPPSYEYHVKAKKRIAKYE
jgi:pSer/pThr/pTyr-binding forkhead associated (FHA) protein